jgi:hypothetical protein
MGNPNQWMDAWMDAWVDAWMDAWMKEGINPLTSGYLQSPLSSQS